MRCRVEKTSFSKIENLRNLFLEATHFQIRYHAFHERGWSDAYYLIFEEKIVGYGSVKGLKELHDRNAIFEFYLTPDYQKYSNTFFEKLITVSGAVFTECQTNDLLMSSMVYEFSKKIHAEVILFKDDTTTNLKLPNVHFRKRKKGENMVEKKISGNCNFVLEKDKKIVAGGGYFLHYNFPFADVHMEVIAEYRRQGMATFILQEIKKECYKAGRVPVARCNISNIGSRKSLIKAGMKIAGYILRGKIKQDLP